MVGDLKNYFKNNSRNNYNNWKVINLKKWMIFII